jgi:maltooligosyltrehalose trehalohydrolase
MAKRKNLMKRRHSMPFGAECRQDGSIRFRLWAPAATRIELGLDDGKTPRRIPMQSLDQGWFELITDAATAGSHYRFRVDGKQQVPDPASRFQPQDVHGPSEVIDPQNFDWLDEGWIGRPWSGAVIYELHVGTFTPAGTFSAACERLDYLADLGVTAIELMPVADFPGLRNWGYDGVLPFAPESIYGRPEDLKNLVQSAHRRGLMVLLDVVYNHFGPEGNYLGSYAPQFFTDRHHTPWGNAINFDGPDSRMVRDFFIQNTLYWISEYHLDGLRLDAVHAIIDDSTPHILTELADAVRNSVDADRHVHLILENDLNQSRFLRRTDRCGEKTYDAQWNDDLHHTLHVLLTGERDGYYIDYADDPLDQLGRSLTEGFAYQGEASLLRNRRERGEATHGVPLTAFVSFLQNHDQIGNRAFGERINALADPRAVRAAAAIVLLAPSPPLFFMGEEFGTQTPFLFFCDFEKGLAQAVAAGRRNELARFERFSNPHVRACIPDPNDETTFESSKLNWKELEDEDRRAWFRFHRHLLKLRCRHIAPRLSDACSIKACYEIQQGQCLTVNWRFADGSKLTLVANLSAEPLAGSSAIETAACHSRILYRSEQVNENGLTNGPLTPWSVVWFLEG